MSLSDYSTWPSGGNLSHVVISNDPISKDFEITWDITSFLRKGFDYMAFIPAKRLKSSVLHYAGVSWQLFVLLVEVHKLNKVGINVLNEHSSSDTMFDYSCRFSLIDCKDTCITDFSQKGIFKFKCGSTSSQQAMINCFSLHELHEFLKNGSRIVCRISIRSLKEACSQTEIAYPSAVESKRGITQLPENGEKEVCHDFKKLLLSGEDTDVTIQVRDQQFKTHRLILAARSPVFASMFRHDTKEKQTGVVDVEDCEPSAFPVLLDYLYCGSTENLSVENVFGLYTAADKYDVQSLKIKCLEFIENSLSVETFCDTVKLSLQHSETNLLKLAIDFFAKCFKKIVKTAKWQAFLLKNPILGNEILIKALASDDDD